MSIKKEMTFLMVLFVFTGLVSAKPMPKKYGKMKNGHVSPQTLKNIKKDARYVQEGYSEKQLKRIIEDPYNNAKTDKEKIAAISAREIIFMVDRSGSMGGRDEDPTGKRRKRWTLWRSAQEAAQSLFEVALALDSDGQLDVVLWDQIYYDHTPRIVHREVKQLNEIQEMFSNHSPQGGTPLADSLEYIYKKKLRKLLLKNEPFTVIVMTDGMPTRVTTSHEEENPKDRVYAFFRKIVSKHKLDQPGRESLAAFSFIQTGDDIDAENFLSKLDDELINGYTDSKGRSYPSLGVDIVDYKKDNYIFGTGTKEEMTDSSGRLSQGGPVAIFWGALFD